MTDLISIISSSNPIRVSPVIYIVHLAVPKPTSSPHYFSTAAQHSVVTRGKRVAKREPRLEAPKVRGEVWALAASVSKIGARFSETIGFGLFGSRQSPPFECPTWMLDSVDEGIQL